MAKYRWIWVLGLALLWGLQAQAKLPGHDNNEEPGHCKTKGHGPYGDDDYYPVGCVNLSGRWKSNSDSNKFLDIHQQDCKGIQFRVVNDRVVKDSLDIDPNGRTYSRDCEEGCVSSQIRARWNSVVFGSSLEINRESVYADRQEIIAQSLHKVHGSRLFVLTYWYLFNRQDDSLKRYVREEFFDKE